MAAVVAKIQAFISGLLAILKQFGLWLGDLFYDIGVSFVNWLVDIFCTVVEWLFSLIDFRVDLFTAAFDWAGLPSSVIYVLNKVGFGDCLIMLAAALLIRVTLNLIPGVFTRV